MVRVFFALGILLLSLQGQAATNELTTQLQRPKRYSITALAQSETNLYGSGSTGNESKGKFNLSGSYKFSPQYRATLTAGLIQEFEGGRQTRGTNSKLAVTHAPIALSQDTNLVPIAGMRLPTNVMDRVHNSYNGSLLSETSVITNWTLMDVPFATVYGLYLTKNFHGFDRGSSGKANIDYSIVNYFGVEKYVTQKLSFLIDADYSYARTYQNSLRTLFSVGQSVSYEFSSDLSVTLGHSNGGDALQGNGTDYDISVFDENTSLIYANVRAVY